VRRLKKAARDWKPESIWMRIGSVPRMVKVAVLFVNVPTFLVSPTEQLASTGWRRATPASVAPFSAVAFFFARELHQRYRVPIGVIATTWGGTAAESWMSRSALAQFSEFAPTLRILDEGSRGEYERFVSQRRSWYQQHATDDRGRVAGRDAWADADLDTSGWPTLELPRPPAAARQDFKGFGGAVWFRRELVLPLSATGCDLRLRLGRVVQSDTAYFNGAKIGETTAPGQLRKYRVPARLLRTGRNVIALRLVGTDQLDDSMIGLFGAANELSATACAMTFPLAGRWSYQPGPDLSQAPTVDPQIAAVYGGSPPAATLFNGMVAPLVQYRIRGVIWYQGETNADENRAAQYRALFPALIKDWRRHWDYELPFLFVQLPGYGRNHSQPADYAWAELREAQSMALSLPSTAMVATVDLGDEHDLHPKNKRDVAHRLAMTAASVVYGENFVHSGPTYQSMQIEERRIRIRYSSVGSGLAIRDVAGRVRGFEIAGADGRFVWARAERDGETIVVSSSAIHHPVAVRYAWRNTPDGNVYNKEGFPAVPFRTDIPREMQALKTAQGAQG
jgi:sialate O-acetylesterase